MGNTFAEVVVACLRAGEADSPFADRVELKSGRDLSYKNVSVKYLKLVLREASRGARWVIWKPLELIEMKYDAQVVIWHDGIVVRKGHLSESR